MAAQRESANISNGTNFHSSQITEGYEGLVKASEDGEHTLFLMVAGIYCAACIQKIEGAVSGLVPDAHARLNFSTGRLQIKWAGQSEQANTFVSTIEKLGYTVSPFNAEKQDSDEDLYQRLLLLCLGVAGFAAGNIMLLSVGLWVTSLETMGMATREFMHWLSATIAIPSVLFCGRPFFSSAYQALKSFRTNMDVPISIALILTLSVSLYETALGGEHVYFDSAVMLTFFLLIGRVLDHRARRRAKTAAHDLMKTMPQFATVLDNNKPIRKLVSDLEVGTFVFVASGEYIPVDGTLQTQTAELDVSVITGESLPQHAVKNDNVFAGTINLSRPITVEMTSTAEDTILSDVIVLMENAEQSQAKYVRIADKAAQLYTPVVHGVSLLAFLFWWLYMGLAWQQALMVAVTVLIITCPCALALAVPIVQVLATGILMKRGVLLKSGDALERLASISHAIFDKTGTLTYGKPRLIGSYNPEDLKLAASLAVHSRHPLSKALCIAYQGDLIALSNIEEVAGEGLRAEHEGRSIKLGRRSWCSLENDEQTEGQEVCLRVEGADPVVFVFDDKLRDDSAETIKKLTNDYVQTVLLSGDRTVNVNRIALESGIDTYESEMSPTQKYDYAQDLQAQDHRILMVGDGLNDAAILSAADVSMAPGSAIDITQKAADIVYNGEALAPVFETYKLAKQTQKLVRQNFALTILYNLIAVPFAFCGLVTPLIAALAMSGSSLLVILNSFRLKLKS